MPLRKFILLFVFLFSAVRVFAVSDPEKSLAELNTVIAQRELFLTDKLNRIEGLKRQARQVAAKDRFDLYDKLYEEYKSFIYDSAFRYARILEQSAYQMKDPQKIAVSKIKLGFVLVSSGLFNETLDTLTSVQLKHLDDSMGSEYYFLMARTHYDLSDFSGDDFYRPYHTAHGNAYMDSAIAIAPKSSLRYLMFTGLKNLRLQNITAAQEAFEALLKRSLTNQQLAVAASTLSFIYHYTARPEMSKEMLIQAAIADLRSCTKETLAMLNLADLLYKEGDIEHAYTYIKIAMDDANFYGARHRKIQVAAVFPIIEGQRLRTVESHRSALLMYAFVITALTVLIIVFAVIIFRQYRKLKLAEQVISDANHRLQEANHQLTDANRIKEEYLWYYFTVTADHITKLDSLKKSLELKLLTKKQEEIKYIVDSINIRREREELYNNFDRVFLKLFPDFVSTFNSYFKDEDKIVLKDGQLLNTELRIFALMRMGIHDNEKIARILDYSVTTIYTYKTRIRSKSTLENDEFDQRIMSIRAI